MNTFDLLSDLALSIIVDFLVLLREVNLWWHLIWGGFYCYARIVARDSCNRGGAIVAHWHPRNEESAVWLV